MAIILNTVTEVLDFIDSFDGYGMVSTDEKEQVEKIMEYVFHYELIDDYKDE